MQPRVLLSSVSPKEFLLLPELYVNTVCQNIVTYACIQAMASFCNQALRGVSQDHSIELLRKFQAVTKEDVLRVLKTGYMPLFDPKHSIAVVVAAPSQVEPVATGLSELGYDVQHRNVEISPDDLSEMDVDGSDSSADEESSSDESTESSEGR